MAETKPIPVRLAPELIRRLDLAAERMGYNRAALIKLCLASFLEAFEKNGFAVLPLDWEAMLASMDGRRGSKPAGGDAPGSPSGAPGVAPTSAPPVKFFKEVQGLESLSSPTDPEFDPAPFVDAVIEEAVAKVKAKRTKRAAPPG